jgi:hypothetical protein
VIRGRDGYTNQFSRDATVGLETARRQVSDWWGVTKLVLGRNKSQRAERNRKNVAILDKKAAHCVEGSPPLSDARL